MPVSGLGAKVSGLDLTKHMITQMIFSLFQSFLLFCFLLHNFTEYQSLCSKFNLSYFLEKVR